MKQAAFSIADALAFAAALPSTPAQAQLSRTFVSAAFGNDASNCDLPTPCRTFQTAHNKTNPDGEVIVLDPGGYGALIITKSISIVNDGVGEASILVSGGSTGIIVNAPPVAGYVHLRGITIQGIGFGGGTGLRFNTGFSLTLEYCVIRNHTGEGIFVLANASSHISVSDTLLADNGGDGFLVQPTGSGTLKVALNRVQAYNNSASGILVAGQNSTGTINATVADSIAANNTGTGFVAISSAGHALTNLMVTRSVSANNGEGLFANGAPVTLRVGQSTVTGNSISWGAVGGAVFRSYGDNNIDGNGDAPEPFPTTIVKK